MIVFVAGMPRSGSTFCFNVAREVLAKDGTVYAEPTLDIGAARQNAGNAAHVIIKGHSDTEALRMAITKGEIRTICSIRSPYAGIASWMDTFGYTLDESISAFKGWLEVYQEIAPYCLTIGYDTIEKRPMEAAASIGGYLLPGEDARALAEKYSKSAVAALADKIDKDASTTRDLGFSYYDTTTFFHRRHVSSLEERVPESTLTSADMAKIRREIYGTPQEKGSLPTQGDEDLSGRAGAPARWRWAVASARRLLSR